MEVLMTLEMETFITWPAERQNKGVPGSMKE